MSEPDQSNQNPAPLNPLGTEEGHVLVAQQKKNTTILWSILGVLILIAAAVFFVLPRFINPPDPSLGPSIAVQNAAQNASASRQEAISPFEEAQRLRQREAAQTVLAELLDLQEVLEEKEVTTWAEDSFTQALSSAANGDAAYREQRFTDAETSYQQALNNLKTIEDNIPNVVNELLNEGQRGLQSESSDAALAAYELAMTISPENEEAVTGIERARVLDELIDLFNQANDAIEQQDFETALVHYQQARLIDPQNERAPQGIQEMNQAIVDRNFTALMSQGYAALQAGRPGQAESFFKQALSVKPSAPDATTALTQVRDQISSAAITEKLNEANRQIQNEDWQAALNAFNDALLIDPNVVAAQNGRDQAQSRLNLDNYFKALLSDPLSLADDTTYEQSLQVYTDALRISDGGPRFVEQMRQAKNYLEQARVPVSLSFYSDGLTQVTLLRHSNMGQFTQQAMTLIPGRYVAIGAREGYQDIRVEFAVPFIDIDDSTIPDIEVICRTPI